MGGLIAAVVILAIALIVLLIVHLLQRRRIKKLAEQMTISELIELMNILPKYAAL